MCCAQKTSLGVAADTARLLAWFGSRLMRDRSSLLMGGPEISSVLRGRTVDLRSLALLELLAVSGP